MSVPRELQVAYIKSADEKIQTLVRLWREVMDAAGSEDAITELKAFAHRIAGSGGSYGFPALSTAARALESELKDLTAMPAERHAIQSRYDNLRRELEQLALAPFD